MKKKSKKMISTILVILMICSIFPKQNVRAAEAELYIFNYTGDVQIFNVPKYGRYKIECYGAGNSYGKGAYAKTEVVLNESDNIYIYCGGIGSTSAGGFNGGGNIKYGTVTYGHGWDNNGKGGTYVTTSSKGFGGSGATDVRVVKATDNTWYDEAHTNWNEDSSLLSRIVTAGGGGGASFQEVNTTWLNEMPPVRKNWIDSYNTVITNSMLGQGSSACLSSSATEKSATGVGTLSGGGGGGWEGGYHKTGQAYQGSSYIQQSYTFNDYTYQTANSIIILNASASAGKCIITYLGVDFAIDIQPVDVTVIEGANVLMRIQSKAANINGRYHWEEFKDGEWKRIGSIDNATGEILKNNLRYEISLETDLKDKQTYCILKLKNSELSKDNNRKYRCVVYDDKNNQIVSEEITLTIKRNGYSSIIATYYKTAEAGTMIDINDVLVALLYESGQPDFANGWSNLYFVITKNIIESRTENKDGSTSNVVEKITEESKKYKIEYGDNLITVRLKDINPQPIIDKDGNPVLDLDGNPTYEDFTKEASFRVTGTDDKKPVFLSTSISEYDVINQDEEIKPIEITFKLDAEDNYTDKNKLVYALKNKKEILVATDFSEEKEYKITVTENATYIAYVKDEAGNIAEKGIEIVVIDDVDPIIKSKALIFKEEDGWVNRNIIKVEATDNYKQESLQYRFLLPDGIRLAEAENKFGMWVNENEITITENGIYGIEVKDFVGNITKTTINVKNVDAVGPEIKNVEIKPIS